LIIFDKVLGALESPSSGRQGQEDSIPPITYPIKVSLIVHSDDRVNPEFDPFTARSLFIAQKLDASRPNQPAQHNTG
jgi:hypothetical protein